MLDGGIEFKFAGPIPLGDEGAGVDDGLLQTDAMVGPVAGFADAFRLGGVVADRVALTDDVGTAADNQQRRHGDQAAAELSGSIGSTRASNWQT